MLAGLSPSCVAVPCDVERWRFFLHAASLVCTLERPLMCRLTCDWMSQGEISARNISRTRTRCTKVDCYLQSPNHAALHALTVPRVWARYRIHGSRVSQNLALAKCVPGWDIGRSSRMRFLAVVNLPDPSKLVLCLREIEGRFPASELLNRLHAALSVWVEAK